MTELQKQVQQENTTVKQTKRTHSFMEAVEAKAIGKYLTLYSDVC